MTRSLEGSDGSGAGDGEEKEKANQDRLKEGERIYQRDKYGRPRRRLTKIHIQQQHKIKN